MALEALDQSGLWEIDWNLPPSPPGTLSSRMFCQTGPKLHSQELLDQSDCLP